MDDPRRILERAAEGRMSCEILPRSGGWFRGQFLRVERGGVVLLAPGMKLSTGEDVRCWFTCDGVPTTFEASVIRTAVPVPDRSQDGFLLGFLDGWSQGEPGQDADRGLDLAILPPNGAEVSVVHGPGRLVEITFESATFTLPVDYTLVFVTGSAVRLLCRVPGEESLELGGRVENLVRGEGYLLYTVTVTSVDDPELFRRVVDILSRAVAPEEP